VAANSIFYHCFRPVVAPRNPANTFFDSATATVQPATRSLFVVTNYNVLSLLQRHCRCSFNAIMNLAIFLRRIFTSTTIRFVIGNDDLGFHFHVGLTGPSTGITTQKVRMYCVPCPAKCHTDYVYCRYEARIQVPWPSLGGIKSTVPGTAKKCFAVPGTAQQSLHTSHYPKNHRLCPINCSVLYGISAVVC
jgi:hypothetical protein